LEPDKRKTVINEIHYWRKNKLLPEHYCDFLLNLYADTEGKTEQTGKSMLTGRTSASIQNIHWGYWLLGTAVIVMFSLFMINFTLFPIQMQIGITSIFILIPYIIGVHLRERNPLGSTMLLAIGSILLIYLGLRIMEGNRFEEPGQLAMFLFVCSTVWMIAGGWARKAVFQFCGWIGWLIVYAWMLYGQLGSISWTASQLSWLPLCVIFGWIGWLCKHRSKRMGNLFFALALVVWFVPELFMSYTSGFDTIIQYSLIGKLILIGLASLMTRKKWSEWVA
jgi:hypothetical protein